MIRCEELFDLTKTEAAELFEGAEYPWEVLKRIHDFILAYQKTLGDDYNKIGEDIYIHKSAKVAPTASITGPVVIGAETEVRHCAFLRGNAFVGRGAVVGNSTELKNVILFDKVQVPHYNYVGDSILGYRSHMGAGSITSNVKSDKSLVVVKENGVLHETGLKKMGAILGDYVEIGCGSILNPGSVICQNTNVYPLSSVRGVIPPNSIYKKLGEVAEKKEPN